MTVADATITPEEVNALVHAVHIGHSRPSWAMKTSMEGEKKTLIYYTLSQRSAACSAAVTSPGMLAVGCERLPPPLLGAPAHSQWPCRSAEPGRIARPGRSRGTPPGSRPARGSSYGRERRTGRNGDIRSSRDTPRPRSLWSKRFAVDIRNENCDNITCLSASPRTTGGSGVHRTLHSRARQRPSTSYDIYFTIASKSSRSITASRRWGGSLLTATSLQPAMRSGGSLRRRHVVHS